MTKHIPTVKEIMNAGTLLRSPSPDPIWERSAECRKVPDQELPHYAKTLEERDERAKSFIAACCGHCTVRNECLRSMLDYPERAQDVVLGGRRAVEVTGIWDAAKKIQELGDVDAALQDYAAQRAKRRKTVNASRAAARAAAPAAEVVIPSLVGEVPLEAVPPTVAAAVVETPAGGDAPECCADTPASEVSAEVLVPQAAPQAA